MNSFKVEGGVKLSGDVFPQGAKNEALQVICAVILTEKEVIIDNIPEILDVLKLIDLLEYIGVKINKIKKNKYSFEAKSIDLNKLNCDIYNEKAKGLRGSIMVIGPLLSNFGKASIPKPGGDKIGRRRLDTHFESLIKLGAKFNYNKQNYIYNVDASSLKGNKILLDQPSVTGTANLIMASALADGETIIYNAACEPYIQQLCKMINNMGGKISGIGSNLIKVCGVNFLKGCNHKIEPDIIEIGSWIGLAALTQSEITIKNVNFNYLEQILNVFTKLGLSFEKCDNDLKIPAQTNVLKHKVCLS
jgi:UDP-N-acetylglucosamine 1-carboxyvinyltransferase